MYRAILFGGVLLAVAGLWALSDFSPVAAVSDAEGATIQGGQYGCGWWKSDPKPCGKPACGQCPDKIDWKGGTTADSWGRTTSGTLYCWVCGAYCSPPSAGHLFFSGCTAM